MKMHLINIKQGFKAICGDPSTHRGTNTERLVTCEKCLKIIRRNKMIQAISINAKIHFNPKNNEIRPQEKETVCGRILPSAIVTDDVDKVTCRSCQRTSVYKFAEERQDLDYPESRGEASNAVYSKAYTDPLGYEDSPSLWERLFKLGSWIKSLWKRFF